MMVPRSTLQTLPSSHTALTHGVGVHHIAQHHHTAVPLRIELPEDFSAAPNIQGLPPEDVQHRQLFAGAEAGRAVVHHGPGARVLGGHLVHAAAAGRPRGVGGSR